MTSYNYSCARFPKIKVFLYFSEKSIDKSDINADDSKGNSRKKSMRNGLCDKLKLSAWLRITDMPLSGIDPATRVKKYKAIARRITNYAIRHGKIFKATECEECGAGDNLAIHHEDYSRPLEVITLCPLCHGKRRVNTYKLTVPVTDEMVLA